MAKNKQTLASFWRRFWRFQRYNNGFAILMRFYERHFSRQGKALFLLFVLSLSLGLVGTDILVYIFMCSSIAFWAAVMWIGFWNRPRAFETQIYFPRQVQAGSPCQIQIRLQYLGKRPLFHVQMELQLRAPQGTIVRLKSDEIALLKPGQEKQFLIAWHPEQRGQVKALGLSLMSTFPLGLMVWRKHAKSFQERWVYPRPRRIEKPRWQDCMRPLWLSSGDTGSSRGDSLEFFGIRPWQPGDSPRHLYWPALARTGQLAVREYQQADGHRIALILDVQATNNEHFEASIKVMAGLLQQIMSDPAHRLCMAWIGKSLHLPQSGQLITDDLLLALAQVHEDPTFQFEYLMQQQALWQHISAVICITTQFEARQLGLQKSLNSSSRHVQFYVVQATASQLPQNCLSVPLEGSIAY